MDLVIEQISPHHPEARALLSAAAAESEALYPSESRHDIDSSEAAAGFMLVAWLDGKAAGCVVLMAMEGGDGEVKRLFVHPAHRRNGLARRLLGSLEDLAMHLGYGTVRLETGTLQLAAVALYEQAGYHRIPPFGDYVDDPLSVCFEKSLVTSGDASMP